MTAHAATPHKTFSPARVTALASNTVLELFRLKIFYFLLLFGMGAMGCSLFFVNLTFQGQFQMLKDVCLGAMSIFTWLLAILPTAMLLPKDIEDRTLYTILAKPVPRFEYLLGKLLGILVLLAIATLLMSLLFAGILYGHLQSAIADTIRHTQPDALDAAIKELRDSAFNINLVPGILLIFIKASLCASLTLMISTFSTSWIFTVIISVTAYFIGSVQGLARAVWQEHSTSMSVLNSYFLEAISIFFPDLQIFNLVDDIVVGTAVPLMIFLKAAALGLGYTSLYLIIAYIMFAWKEL